MVFAVIFLFHVKLVVFTRNFCIFVVVFARYIAFFSVSAGFFWGYFLVLDVFCYVFAFNGCTYLKF